MRTYIDWIRSADALPDADTRVLIAYDGDVFGAVYDEAAGGCGPWWVRGSGDPILLVQEVTHWAHLPEVPT